MTNRQRRRATGASRATRRRPAPPRASTRDHARAHVASADAGTPLVSACLIVRDEAHQIEACLASIADVADEIIVHDTGSLDDTAELARSVGARVSTGTFDGDFAAARNAALAHCRGEWILWIDADERLVLDDPARLRSVLRTLPRTVDGMLVPIDNLRGTETAPVLTHTAARLFRRRTCRWEGHLHEQVTRRDGAPPALGRCELVRLLHRGYLDQTIRARHKPARNVASARAEVCAGGGTDPAAALTNLGRSHMLAGNAEAGIELCRRAIALSEPGATRRLAQRALCEGLLALKRYPEVLEVTDELRTAGAPELADLMSARSNGAAGNHEEALVAARRVVNAVDLDGFEYGPHLVAQISAQALLATDRPDEAADALLETLRTQGGLDGHLGLLVEALEAATRDLGVIADTLDPARIRDFVPPLLQLDPPTADRVLDAWHRRDPLCLPVLAGAAQVALHLPIERQLLWSSRLRSAGLAASCPVIAAAFSSDAAGRDRVLGAAAAFQLFSDERARLVFAAAVLELAPAEAIAIREELTQLAPSLVPDFDVLAASRLPARSNGPAFSQGRVLVAAGLPGALRPRALALVLRAAGADVALLEQAAPDSSRNAAGAFGLEGERWSATADPARALCAAVARESARRRIDAVLLTTDAPDVADELRHLTPGTTVVNVDAAEWAPVSSDVLAFGEPLPFVQREGLLVVAVAPARLTAFDRVRARCVEIVDALPATPVALAASGNSADLRTAVPSALVLPADADPRAVIAVVRGLVIVDAGQTDETREWQALAAAAGTPAEILDPSDNRSNLQARLAALLARGARDSRAESRTPSAGRQICAELASVVRHRPPSPTRAVSGRRVVMTSTTAGLDSLAQVNRELVRHLATASSAFTVEVAPSDGPLAGSPGPAVGAGVEIRHQWPPDFRASDAGRLVLIQPFEFGGLPAEWIAPLRDVVDELWVPTSFVRDGAIASGVPAQKVHVVPNGVDEGIFRPEGPRRPATIPGKTRLVFVGGCLARKGFDVLLETYLATFRSEDDVCLVVKPYGAQGVYANQTFESDLRAAAASGGPAIEIVEGDLTAEELAALYRSCDALVHPYRGEGFALPVAEALASGVPAIVTAGGACDDYCDDEVAWMLPARSVGLHPHDFTPTDAGAWWLEPSRSALAAAMRAVVADPDGARRRGAAGRCRVAGAWTWRHAAASAAVRLEALLDVAPPVRKAPT